MNSSQKTEFSILCRELRMGRHLKQREVAQGIGVKPSTYGNIESSKWMVVGQERARVLAKFYDLDRDGTDRLIDAWHKLPLSPYGEKRRKTFARSNAQRSKARHHDKLMLSLCEVLGLLLPMVPEERICACDLTSTCEVCAALENIGLTTFTNLPATIDALAKLQGKLELAAAPVPEPAAT